MLKPSNQLMPVKKEAEQTAGPPETKRDSLRTLMRLLVGGAVFGADGLLRRSKQWQAEIQQAAAPKMIVVPFSELERNQRRHTLIGLLFETPEVMSSGLAKAGRASGAAAGLVGKVLGPIANSRLARPVKRRYDKLVARGESTLERWAERGRVEEQASRALTEQAMTQLFDEVMDMVMIHLAEKPELRDLLQQQSVSMAGEVVGEVRQRTADADAILERLARAMLRRSPHEAVVELPTPAAPSAGDMEKK
ncbi:MAG TPA: hypothetical protein VEC96_14245 [Anaerolineae bacterium]|nr:hypothetical protein [Anaerolineae bacterium]